ncbi:MAG: transporter substrate-binding domain-containing protein, partial [Opitutaceae bacterium]
DSAGALGIDRDAARAFMETQISAARALQEGLLADWSAGRATPPRARDLPREIRPELDRIGLELLLAVRAVAASTKSDSELTRLREEIGLLGRRLGFPGDFAVRLSAAIAGLRITAPATMAGLRQAGVLRVGLTGDYAPFSEERAGELRGFDVALAREFAAMLGGRVTFVRTTWSRLMEDLLAGRFDFAAGGISVTPERRGRADFGPTLLVDGKTPIARCADRGRFGTLEEINRPDVRVIVNPGGTNERFAREHLPRASLRVFPDNRLIFAEILAGRADVMVTDAVEVRLQVARQPGLCGTRAEPFTRFEKAWMFPRGAEVAAEAEGWLTPRIESGEIARRLDAAIAGAR